MADRTVLTKSQLSGPYHVAGDAVTWTAADVANKNSFVATGKEVLLARNSNTGSTAHTVSVTSVANRKNRTGDVNAVSIAAGATRMWSFRQLAGWVQSNGSIYLEANHNEILFAVVQVP